jgi:hypothetical protein
MSPSMAAVSRRTGTSCDSIRVRDIRETKARLWRHIQTAFKVYFPASYEVSPTGSRRDTVPSTLILLTWRIWWASNNASKWQMGFNLAFKGLLILMWHDLVCFDANISDDNIVYHEDQYWLHSADQQKSFIAKITLYDIFVNCNWIATRWHSTVHIYTQTNTKNNTKQTIHKTTQNLWKSAGRAPSLRVLPWHLPYNWGKSTEKPQSG